MTNNEASNSKAITPIQTPDETQLKEEIGQVIENASSNDEIFIVIRKTKTGGWHKYIGPTREEAELTLAETQTEKEEKKKSDEERKAKAKNETIRTIIDSLGDQALKLKRGF